MRASGRASVKINVWRRRRECGHAAMQAGGGGEAIFPRHKMFLVSFAGKFMHAQIPCRAQTPASAQCTRLIRWDFYHTLVMSSDNENVVGMRSACDKCRSNRFGRIEKDQSTSWSSLMLGSPPLRYCSTFAFREREEEKEVGIWVVRASALRPSVSSNLISRLASSGAAPTYFEWRLENPNGVAWM